MAGALKSKTKNATGGPGKWWLIVEELSTFRWIEVFGPYEDAGDAWDASGRAYLIFRENETDVQSMEVLELSKKAARALSSSESKIEVI